MMTLLDVMNILKQHGEYEAVKELDQITDSLNVQINNRWKQIAELQEKLEENKIVNDRKIFNLEKTLLEKSQVEKELRKNLSLATTAEQDYKDKLHRRNLQIAELKKLNRLNDEEYHCIDAWQTTCRQNKPFGDCAYFDKDKTCKGCQEVMKKVYRLSFNQ